MDWAVKVSDTRYRFSEKTVHTIVDYFLDGMCKQMVYGTMVDPGVRNRDIARPSGRGAMAAARRAGEPARPLRGSTALPLNLLKIADGYRQAELEEIVAARRPQPYAFFCQVFLADGAFRFPAPRVLHFRAHVLFKEQKHGRAVQRRRPDQSLPRRRDQLSVSDWRLVFLHLSGL